MRKHWRVIAIPLLLAIVMITSSVALAKRDPGGPATMTGEIEGAAYKIRVPANWNGTLLVYAHGYAMEPVMDPEAAFLGEKMEHLLLAQGYALAASGFRGSGWNVAEGIEDIARLTDLFKQDVGTPERVILYGISMGGIVTLKGIEEYPELYDGAIPMCSDSAGAIKLLNSKLDYAVSYDAAFGWPTEPWTDESGEHDGWGEVGNVRDDLDFYPDVWFAKAQEEVANPANAAKWEFVRLVNNLPLGGYYEYTGPVEMPPAIVAMTYFMSAQRAEIELRAGEPASSNVDHVYSLTERDIDHLLGLDASLDITGTLAHMNDMTGIEASSDAIRYLTEHGEFSGKIEVPVLMLHNVEDSISPAEHTTVYLETVTAAHKKRLLRRVYSDLPGHCNFTEEQILTMFDAMDSWLDSGKPPGDDAFPTTLSFNTVFEPGPWPQPPTE
jgi:pimeloyl-ACP methyl ester carboxylesterase